MTHGGNAQQRVSNRESPLRPELEHSSASNIHSPVNGELMYSAARAETAFPPQAIANLPRLVAPPEDALATNGLRPAVFESGELGLLRPHHALSESGSGVSDWSFASIEPIYDRGSEVHQEWEESVVVNQSSPPPATLPHTQQPLTQDTRRLQIVNLESVGEEICTSFKKSAFDGRKYIPLDRLCEILSHDVVSELLRQHADFSDVGHDEGRGLESRLVEILGTRPVQSDGDGDGNNKGKRVRSLPPRRRRIFAILVLIEKIGIIDELIKEGVDDKALPLAFDHDAGSNVWYMVSHSSGPKVRLRVPWSASLKERFLSYQETIHVPFFKFPGDVIYFYDLGYGSTLPFSFYEPRGVGGYGSVHKVRIHQAHHGNGNTAEDRMPRDVAIKRLHVPHIDEFLNEIAIFDKMGTNMHDSTANHLIPLQLAYKHGSDFCLVFPWADGNLREFWQQQQAAPEDLACVRWFFEQCHGIARGLRKIHHLTTSVKKKPTEAVLTADNATAMLLGAGGPDEREWGRHGDIKPENILWCRDYGGHKDHLLISDFGLTRFSTAHSRSHVPRDQVQGLSGTYRPPDLDLHGKTSQRYDLWSLGCVLLEFTSWFLLGFDETHTTFTKERNELVSHAQGRYHIYEDKFFDLKGSDANQGSRREAVVKSSVTNWIRKLHGSEHCTEPLHSLLNLIQYKMLVPEEKHRWGSKSVLSALCDIHIRCGKDADYAKTPVNRGPDPSEYPRDRQEYSHSHARVETNVGNEGHLLVGNTEQDRQRGSGNGVGGSVDHHYHQHHHHTSSLTVDEPLEPQESIRQQTLSVGSHFEPTLHDRDAGSVSGLSLSAASAYHSRGDVGDADHRQPAHGDPTHSNASRSLRRAPSAMENIITGAPQQDNDRRSEPHVKQRSSLVDHASYQHEEGENGNASRWRKVIHKFRKAWKVFKKKIM